jgi:hypothetical protein
VHRVVGGTRRRRIFDDDRGGGDDDGSGEHDADTEPCGDGPLQSGVLSRAACREEGKGGREAGREGQTDARSCETRRGSVGVTE